MELTQEEKQAILEQRLKQFATEKFNQEINKQVLEAQLTTINDGEKPTVEAQILETDKAIAIIQSAIATTKNIADGQNV